MLVGLAKCLRVGELGTAEAILHQAQRAGQALELDAAHWALGRLASRQVLRKPLEEADFYEFTADLYYTWIRLAHSLTQPMTDGVPVY